MLEVKRTNINEKSPLRPNIVKGRGGVEEEKKESDWRTRDVRVNWLKTEGKFSELSDIRRPHDSLLWEKEIILLFKYNRINTNKKNNKIWSDKTAAVTITLRQLQ